MGKYRRQGPMHMIFGVMPAPYCTYCSLDAASAIDCTPNQRPVACVPFDRTRLSSP